MLVVAMTIVFVGVDVLKDAVDRPRPEGGLVSASGSAFPSGHAAYSTIYVWLAVTVVVRLRPGLTYATAIVVTGIALTAAVGLTRVYLGVHYLTDVFGGWALGISAFAGCATVALVVTHLRKNWRPWRRLVAEIAPEYLLFGGAAHRQPARVHGPDPRPGARLLRAQVGEGDGRGAVDVRARRPDPLRRRARSPDRLLLARHRRPGWSNSPPRGGVPTLLGMPAKRAEPKKRTPAAAAPRGSLDALSEAVESGAGLPAVARAAAKVLDASLAVIDRSTAVLAVAATPDEEKKLLSEEEGVASVELRVADAVVGELRYPRAGLDGPRRGHRADGLDAARARARALALAAVGERPAHRRLRARGALARAHRPRRHARPRGGAGRGPRRRRRGGRRARRAARRAGGGVARARADARRARASRGEPRARWRRSATARRRRSSRSSPARRRAARPRGGGRWSASCRRRFRASRSRSARAAAPRTRSTSTAPARRRSSPPTSARPRGVRCSPSSRRAPTDSCSRR